ncbi:hypothetical protein SANTM175S_07197 [Streptomyces antimycoticus]
MGLPLRATKASCVRGLVAGAVATLVLAALGCQQTDGGQGQAGTRSSPAHSAHATTATSARPPSTTPPHGTAASAPPRTVPSVREFTPTTGPGWRPGSGSRVVADLDGPLADEARTIAAELGLRTASGTPRTGDLSLALDPGQSGGREAYTLTVGGGRARITGPADAGGLLRHPHRETGPALRRPPPRRRDPRPARPRPARPQPGHRAQVLLAGRIEARARDGRPQAQPAGPALLALITIGGIRYNLLRGKVEGDDYAPSPSEAKSDIESLHSILAFDMFAIVIFMAAAVLALLLVRQITAMQEQRASLPPQMGGPAAYGMPAPNPYGAPAPWTGPLRHPGPRARLVRCPPDATDPATRPARPAVPALRG